MMKWIILLGSMIMMLLAFRSHSPFKVSGTVNDRMGNPVAFAAVVEKNTKNAVQTDASGQFTITCSNENATLVISSVGYASATVKVKGRNTLTVQLTRQEQHLEEVVVTGYGVANDQYSGYTAQAYSGRVRGMALPYNGVYQQQPRPGAMADSFNTEEYDGIVENTFRSPVQDPLSTFSIDVDAASYSNVRRMINEGMLPPAGAVRIEEMINYFHYNYPQPSGKDPFSITTSYSTCPWNKDHQLVLIGLQGKQIPVDQLPASNLVFLVDVSGSMEMPNKLPLVKTSLKMLTEQLREQDRISIVVYAGNAGLVLPATSGANKQTIVNAIDKLEAGGSTAGGEGIQLAYKVAKEQFMKNGNNRVILCTDGDFNVGMSSNAEMEKLIEKERASGVFLTVLGYGVGNYKDSKMQILADKGNGNHAYIDGIQEAKKVLVNEFGGTLFTIAKDVKLQVEFNPQQVQGYRLIGYENRMLNKEDFNDDTKDAGELGSGHTVTALYEIIPVGVKAAEIKAVDPLKYQSGGAIKSSDELLTVKFRYQPPQGGASILMQETITGKPKSFDAAHANLRFAAAVAEFGLLLRQSRFRGEASFHHVYRTGRSALGNDAEGYRKEFLKMVKKASALKAADLEEDDEDVSINN